MKSNPEHSRSHTEGKGRKNAKDRAFPADKVGKVIKAAPGGEINEHAIKGPTERRIKRTTAPISLPRTEVHQAVRKSRSEMSAEDFRKTTQQIAGEPDLQREVIANPYAEGAKRQLTEKFPNLRHADAIRAAVMAEPEGAYKRKEQKGRVPESELRKLPLPERLVKRKEALQQRKEILLDELDMSVDMVVRMKKYVTDNMYDEDKLWQQSDEEKYRRLSEVAFGTTDAEEIVTDYSKSQRRSMRLGIVNLIEDFRDLMPYREQLETDGVTAIERILREKVVEGDKTTYKPLQIEGEVGYIPLAFGCAIVLEDTDFYKVEPEKDLAGIVLSTIDYLDPVMQNRVTILNKIDDEGALFEVLQHEAKHIIYDGFFEQSMLPSKKMGDKIGENFANRYYKQGRDLIERTKDEKLAYLSESPGVWLNTIDHVDSGTNMGENLFILWHNLWSEDEMTLDDKTALFTKARGIYDDTMRQIGEYQWVVHKLDDTAQGEADSQTQQIHGAPLTEKKVEALLQVTRPQQASLLAEYYLGIEPAKIPQLMKKDLQKDVKDISDRAASIIQEQQAGRLSTEEQQQNRWNENFYITDFGKLQFADVKDALPVISNIIEHWPDEEFIATGIGILDTMLYRYFPQMSAEELANTRQSIGNMCRKRTGVKYDDVKKDAMGTLKFIDQVVRPGGVNFTETPTSTV